jgi:hypothetical protein
VFSIFVKIFKERLSPYNIAHDRNLSIRRILDHLPRRHLVTGSKPSLDDRGPEDCDHLSDSNLKPA